MTSTAPALLPAHPDGLIRRIQRLRAACRLLDLRTCRAIIEAVDAGHDDRYLSVFVATIIDPAYATRRPAEQLIARRGAFALVAAADIARSVTR